MNDPQHKAKQYENYLSSTQGQPTSGKKNAPFRRVMAETIKVEEKFADNSFDAKKGKKQL
jgi:hypothetical protein